MHYANTCEPKSVNSSGPSILDQANPLVRPNRCGKAKRVRQALLFAVGLTASACQITIAEDPLERLAAPVVIENVVNPSAIGKGSGSPNGTSSRRNPRLSQATNEEPLPSSQAAPSEPAPIEQLPSASPPNLAPVPVSPQSAPQGQEPISSRGVDPYTDDLDRELARLRHERNSLKKSLDETGDSAAALVPDASSTLAFQRQSQLRELLHHLATKGLRRPRTPIFDEPLPARPTQPNYILPESAPPPATIDLLGQPVDAIAMGKTAFQAGDYARAVQAFRMVDMNTVPTENRPIIQYLLATSLRRLGRVEEAIKSYEEVAFSATETEMLDKGNDSLRNYAKWQVENLRWQQKVESHLNFLRDRRATNNGTEANPAPANP